MLTVDETEAEFSRLRAAARVELFKAEVLQDYTAIDDGPSFQAWKAGDKAGARALIANDMADWIETTRQLKAPITRVHVIEEPLTPYMEWEIDCTYGHSILPAKTERIFLAKAADVAGPLPAGDFWIIDEKAVVEWVYEGPNNALAGGNVYETATEVERYLLVRNRLLAVGSEMVLSPDVLEVRAAATPKRDVRTLS